MKQVLIRRPGIGGMNTDVPPWAIKQTEASRLVDGLVVNGVVRQRRGWEYRTASAPSSVTKVDAHGEYSFTLGDRTVRMCVVDGAIYVEKSDGTWLNVFDSTGMFSTSSIGTALPKYLPRAVYYDEVILCPTGGDWPSLRWAGSAFVSASPSSATYAANKNTATTAGSFSAGIGAYLNPTGLQQATASLKITEYAAQKLTLDGLLMKSTVIQPGANSTTSSIGSFWPCQDVYSEGTITINGSGLVTGDGAYFEGSSAKWGDVISYNPPTGGMSVQNLAAASVMADVLMVERLSGLTWTTHPINSSTTTTLQLDSTGAVAAQATSTRFAILRRLGVSDVAVRSDCLFGAGNKQYPSRLWYSPPTWNPSVPPIARAQGGTWDFTNYTFGGSGGGDLTGTSEFQLDWIDVPATGDGDKIVALLSSDGPLIVLKRNSAHSVSGTWPNFTQTMLANGAGCVDPRAVADVRGFGSFWAGKNGIYAYRFGNVTDLTSDRVSEEWRRRIRAFNADTGSTVTLGVTHGHLVVSAYLTGDGTGTPDQFTWMCNLKGGAWSAMTNIAARYMQNVKTKDGIEVLLGTLRNETKPVELSTIFTGKNANDANLAAPSLEMTLSSSADDNDPDTEARLVEVSTTMRFEDTTTAGSTVAVSVSSSGAVDQTGASVEPCGTVSATLSPTLKRERLRAGVTGRQHSVTMKATTTSNNVATEVHEIGLTLRDKRPRR